MKKIYIILLSVLMISSCTMELEQEGVVSDSQALQTASDYQKFARGMHAFMRRVTTGIYVTLSDIQLDDFNAVIGNGNNYMEFSNGILKSSTAEISSIYSGYYTIIAEANFIIDNGDDNGKGGKLATNLSATERSVIGRAVGQAYFVRAFCYAGLADRFCQSYINCAQRDAEGTGLSLQLTYHPTSDNAKYPGRSSLTKTYSQIIADLQRSIEYLTAYESATEAYQPQANAIYISSDVAKALLARVYLNIGDNENAILYAKSLIDAKAKEGVSRYSLVKSSQGNYQEFINMWLNDESSEFIYITDGDYEYHGSAIGSAFMGSSDKVAPYFCPTRYVVDMLAGLYNYKKATNADARFIAWFVDNSGTNIKAQMYKEVNVNGTDIQMIEFAKYPGNAIFNVNGSKVDSKYIHKGKPFRISEMFLIAAEAYLNMGDETNGRNMLMSVQSARNADLNGKTASLTGTELIDELRKERRREFIGEGMRQTDLKRWNVLFVRDDQQVIQGKTPKEQTRYIYDQVNTPYVAGDYRLTWPIPQAEIDINPQIRNQQNPGY